LEALGGTSVYLSFAGLFATPPGVVLFLSLFVFLSGKTSPPYKSRKLLTFKHVSLGSLWPARYLHLPGNNGTRAFPLNVAVFQKLFLHTLR